MGQREERLKSSWPATLLAASILSSCFLLAPAKESTKKSTKKSTSPDEIPVTWEPAKPEVGGTITLQPKANLKHIYCCKWYRGEASTKKVYKILEYYPETKITVQSSAYSDREAIEGACVLVITDLILRDSGEYIVKLEKPGRLKGLGFAKIKVSGTRSDTDFHIACQPSKPSLGDTVTLRPRVSLGGITYCKWYQGPNQEDNNMIALYELETHDKITRKAVYDRGSIEKRCILVIRDLELSDSGEYTMEIKEAELVRGIGRAYIDLSVPASLLQLDPSSSAHPPVASDAHPPVPDPMLDVLAELTTPDPAPSAHSPVPDPSLSPLPVLAPSATPDPLPSTLSLGVVAGIVVWCLIVMAVTGVLLSSWLRTRRQRGRKQPR
ncbi:carcinoembryonic antigen-related cell adhesion molecule 5-like [Hemicordylus capensis]|uniref:carcinoembryonic antigen-related cell adhesion molecule 5-like n=1 Tax=Hemicordylus capensis TaxID=884348 RepID=UPI002303CE2B|nr:carcinoembryonic antigen-related cell adhesion molecule 5-like [Hemicordylus capensis]